MGVGLDGVLRARGDRYVGILNGIDTHVWNPATDPYLPAHFTADDLAGKAECKRALLAEFGLPRGDDAMARPLIGMVSRLVAQKGSGPDSSGPARDLVALDAAFVFVGPGRREIRRRASRRLAAALSVAGGRPDRFRRAAGAPGRSRAPTSS